MLSVEMLEEIAQELNQFGVDRSIISNLIMGVYSRISTNWKDTMENLPGHLYEITRLRKIYRNGRQALNNNGYGDSHYSSHGRATVSQQKWSTASSQRGALRNLPTALTQLNGANGELPPSSTDRLVADVVIQNISESEFSGKLNSFLDTGLKSFSSDILDDYRGKAWEIRVTHIEGDGVGFSKKNFYSFDAQGNVQFIRGVRKERAEVNDVIRWMTQAKSDYENEGGKDAMRLELRKLAETYS